MSTEALLDKSAAGASTISSRRRSSAKKPSTDEEVVNFKKLLRNHRERTESSNPFTIQQTEDVMFIDEKRVIAMEYIFYQKDEQYYRIKPQKDDVVAVNKLGTEEYLDDLNQNKINELSAFKSEPINL